MIPRSVAAYAARQERESQTGSAPMRFLVNPGQTRDNMGGGIMARRKTPPRYKSGPKKGQFMPKGARRKARRNPVAVRARASSGS